MSIDIFYFNIFNYKLVKKYKKLIFWKYLSRQIQKENLIWYYLSLDNGKKMSKYIMWIMHIIKWITYFAADEVITHLITLIL